MREISDDSVSRAFSSKWRGPSFWVPALGRSGGVAILCSEAYAGNVSVWQRDVSERVPVSYTHLTLPTTPYV